MTEMSQEIAVSTVFTTLPEAPRADSDDRLLEIWLHGRSKHTQRAYRADVGHFLAWVRKPFLQVTLADLQQFADSLGELAPASRYRTLSAIKSLLAFAHRTGYLPYDVGRALRLPAVRSRLAERILPEADLHRILSLEANLRNRAILTLLYASGMRVSELCGLCWRDLQPNSDGGQVTVLGKGDVTRAVKIPASVWKLVTCLRGANAEPGDPVFRSRKAKTAGFCGRSPCSRWCARRRRAPALNWRCRPTGSVTPTLLMPLTAARPSTWCRPPSATPAS
jgi:integrase/recombinase XerD